MEREREIPDVFDVFAIGKSPLPLANDWKYLKKSLLWEKLEI